MKNLKETVSFHMNRQKAMQWWNVLSPNYKQELTERYIPIPNRKFNTLTGREIQLIFHIEMN